MRIGKYRFDMDQYEKMDNEKLAVFIEALTLYAARKQEVDNAAAALSQFLDETIAEIETNYFCKVLIDGEPWKEHTVRFVPSEDNLGATELE